MMFGGFAAEHASVSEYDSPAAFAAELEAVQFTDYFWTTRRVRYRRPAGSRRQPLELETSWSPGAMTSRFAAIDGARVEQPVAAIDGVPAEALPFLNEPFESIPSFFPWADLTVAWGDVPSAIGDREQ
ncbi:hypothetical protein [Cohnella rhizosphaerae]|uniref:Uncharacterized protein n=1 Tax=Cohnella rhizosphaerae TaxID=1457232 RepID=A0A9X4QVM6_9BACL|nr:hypothetical protein [Cohnella rhizosphaerae]MDG0813521.1 hypothetical protein [Cohnella rhizosphaerae]